MVRAGLKARCHGKFPVRDCGKMRILYVLNTFNLPDQAGSGRFYHFARWAVKQGHDITIFCNARHNWTDDIVFRGSIENPDVFDGIKVVGLSTPAGRRKSKLLRAINYLWLTVQVYLKGRKLRNLDVVIAGTPPLFVPRAALAVAMHHKALSVLEVRDLYPHTAVALGVVRNPLIIKAWRMFEDSLRRGFERIVVSVPRLLPMLVEEGVREEKITVITNGYDLENDESADLSGELAEFFDNNKGRFIVGYTGNMGLAWNIPCMVKAAMLLKDRDDIAFFFLGKGEHYKNCARMARENGLENVAFFPPVGRKQALEATRRCKALMFMYFDDDFFNYALPNKFFDYMGSGRPLIYGGSGSVEDILEKSDGGLVVPANNTERLAGAIMQLADNPGRAAKMGSNNRHYVEAHLLREQQHAKWKKVLG